MSKPSRGNKGDSTTTNEAKPFAFVNRLSEPLADELNKKELELLYLARRLGYIRSVYQTLVSVTRGRRFNICHEPTWRMLLSERDMIVIDLASWIKGLYSRGGFLRRLQGDDLRALSRRWPDAKGRDCETSREAYSRLFPNAIKHLPSMQDINALVELLEKKFEPVRDDRDIYRAHKHEDERPASTQMLSPEKVAGYLSDAMQLIADLRFLCSRSATSDLHLAVAARDDDAMAKDAVDLVLVGTLRWITYLLPIIPDSDTARMGAYDAWRAEHYRLIHAVHDRSGEADGPINADDHTLSLQLRTMLIGEKAES